MNSNEAYIIDGVRTPIGRLRGGLSGVRADDLAAHVIRQLLNRNLEVKGEYIDDVIFGNSNQAGEDNRNVARMALLLAGLPVTVPGETVNRLCASGMSAVIHAQRAIKSGDAQFVIAGGVEHMTRSPYVISKVQQPYGGDARMYDSSFGWRFVNPLMHKMYGTEAMGETAENLVDLHHISREDQDKFALYSHKKASAAQKEGILAEEIISVDIQEGKNEKKSFLHDEFIRHDTDLESLGSLKPAFRKEGGTVTAGNSSGLNDGAAALLIASLEAVQKFNLTPLARIVASQVVGVEPRIMGIGPVEATMKLLQRTGLTLKDIDVIEINEAFAAQALACTRSLGLSDSDERINPNGGAIALGHPLGMTGARIILTAARQLNRTGGRYALVTMCIGVGQGYAVILERSNK